MQDNPVYMEACARAYCLGYNAALACNGRKLPDAPSKRVAPNLHRAWRHGWHDATNKGLRVKLTPWWTDLQSEAS